MNQFTFSAFVANSIQKVLQSNGKSLRFAAVLFALLIVGVGNAWGAVESGKTYSVNKDNIPTDWSSKEGANTSASYFNLNSSEAYIQTDEFCVKSFTKIVLEARKYGGPSAAQALITVEWIADGSSTVLGTIAPTSTSLTNYTISSPASITSNKEGYVKISCKGASSSKGSGVSEVTITYTEGSCSDCTPLEMSEVTATAGDRQIQLSWDAVDNASSYEVTCSGGTVGSITGTTKICIITGLTNGTEYTWSVMPVGDGTTYCTENTSVEGEATPNVFYTVTWMNNGVEYTTTQVAGGSKPTFPDTPKSCDDTSNSFYGWATASWSGKINDLGGKTIYTSANAMLAVDDNITYYAVFCEGGGSGNGRWVQCESLDDFIDGEYYMFVSPEYDNDYYYVPAVSAVTAAGNFSKAGASVFGVTDVTSITKEQGGWKLIKSNSNWKIQSSNNDDIYLYATAANNGLAANSSSNASSTWSVTKHSTQSTFAFKYNDSRYLSAYNTSPYGFRTYTGTGTNGTAYLTVYKLEVASNPINFLTQCTTETTVTLNPNGGTFASTPDGWTPVGDNYVITHTGTEITLPTNISQEGKIFGGWYKEETKYETIPADLTESITLTAKWLDKQDAGIYWDPESVTVTIDADGNILPEFNNPNEIDGIEFSSSNPSVVAVDANGVITLGSTGTTATVTITATFDGNETYAAKTVTCSITVHPSNCRWVETEIGDIDSGDEVVITMTTASGVTYALPSNQSTGSNPQAITVEIDGNCLKNNASTQYVWIINKDRENLTFESLNHADYVLNCTNADAGVRVSSGSDKNKIFVIDPTSGYLKNTQTTDARYLGVHNTNYYWYCYKTYGNNTGGQTLKFYKRECLDSEHYWVTWDAGEGLWTDGSSKKLESYAVGADINQPADPSREGYRFDGWEPVPTTMPAQNTTFTAKWTEVYTITWYENDVPSYTEVPSDNPVVTWKDDIADCGEKKFYGWTADDTFVSDPTTPPTLISKGTTIAGDVTYYAVYADAEEPANPGYTKVTTISEGTYLIATGETSDNLAYTGKYPEKSYGGTCEVIVGNSVISNKPMSAVEVEVTLGTDANSGKFAIYDGTYYLSAPNANELTFNDNIVYDWQLTAEGYINSTGRNDRYIQLNSSANPKRFACYTTNQKKAYLYKKQTTTYENFAVSCATYKISITPPTGGMVTTTPADEAGEGQTITVNVTPDDCKYLTALKYNDGSDNINIASTPYYTFTMPAADVTVTATFADKIATDIEVITSAHRMLMQGSAFIGEQVRITYNNGDKETLNWNDSRLTFTGHNTATLGSQTVTVTYNGCGTQSVSYNIEVIDGVGITFWDDDYTETIKYEPGDLVDVDNKIGQNICSGWEFAGWSETKVANESEEYVPVHNFNATDAKVLYAVYVKKKAQWTTIVTADEAKSGAKYVLAYDRYDTYYALTSSVKDVNYLEGKVVTSTEGELNSFDVYYLSEEPTADLIWELISTDENGKWYLYNKNTAKYIDLSTQGQIHLTDLPSDKLQMESGYNDSQIRIASSTEPTYYLSWDNNYTRYNTYASSNSQEYWYTKDEEFTSTPPCSPLSATFYGNGGIVTDGKESRDYLPIEEPTRDAGITTPTAYFADCNGKSWTFVGWSRKEIDVTRVPVLTTDLLHDGGGNKHYYIQEDGEEFWAVYTNQGTPETKYGTITFTDDDVTRQYENAKTITKSVTAMGDYDFELYHVSNASSKGIQFDHDIATRGYIKNITSLGKINSISLNDFQVGDINYVKVYVGNMPNAINTLLTEADLQQTGSTYTYYPPKNYAYVKIEANGYCGITSISIDFGKGTKIWATTPDCSTITLSGDEIYVTATNGRAVMAPTTLTVKANQLEANADVILTSNSSDVYFSTDRTFNFAAGQAESQKPKTSLTLPTDAEGNLATTDVYIHYMPNSEGNGVPADVVISANLETPNPSITDDHTIHVRNLPAKFVIATKVGATWYALPANMTGETNPLAEVIEVDETTMTATAPNTSTYTLWPVKTTNGIGNRYADYGDRLRFAAVNNEQRGLWANNNNNSSAIRNYAVINSLGADALAAYEWKVTTTVVDGHWQYTLQTDQDKNQNFLRYWTSAEGTPVGPKWGTYNAGENKLYFLPVTETQPFEYAVVEWYPTKVLIQTDAAITSPTVKVDGEAVASPILTNKGGKLYEISNLPLETNPNKLLQVSFTDDAINYTNTKVVPIILSREEKSITGEPFTTLTQKEYQYADVVVRDGATLSIDGTTDVANTLLGVTIYPTAKVSVAEGKKLSVHSLTFFGGIDEIYDGSAYTINKYGVPQLSLKGILNKTITTMDYIMRVNLDQMYSLTVPYDVQLADIKYWDGSDIALGSALYVSAYDGGARANQSKKTWIYETDFESRLGAATLKAGVGYTISAELQAGVGNEYSILRMPMMSNVASGATEVAKTVAVTAWGKDANVTDNHKGWNLVGNPYMTTIQGADDADLVLGYLKETGTGPWEWVEKAYRYVTIPSDDGTYYWQQKFTDAVLPPFKNFFVQVGTTGELVFGLSTRKSMPARSTQAAIEKEVEFEILMSNDALQDNTGLLISEEYSPAYEINADLEKMIGSMSVYTIYGGYKLAYNALSPINASEWIPMGYVAPAAGEYTFRLDDIDKIVEQVEHVYLIDYEANNIVDLMDDEYEFTTDKEQNNNRFAINVVLSQDKDNTTTGLDIIQGNNAAPIKFIYHDKMYIQSGEVIYDGTGKQVTNINK